MMLKTLLLVVICFYGAANSAKRTAVNISYSACSTMVANLASGDTGYIPYGNAVWKKPITIQNKSVTIIGIVSGSNLPTIIDSVPTGLYSSPFCFNVRVSDKIQISYLKFYTMVGKNNGTITIEKSNNFRVDHCVFYDSTATCRAIYTLNGACGLIDNCEVNFRRKGTGQGMTFGGSGATSWAQPSSYGTDKNVFVEDCSFKFSYPNDCTIDAFDGARVVVRYCSIVGANLTWHGFDSNNAYRSPFSFEIYHNTFNANTASIYTAIRSRGGSALVYSNKFIGSYNAFFMLSNYRSCPYAEGEVTEVDGLKVIDTSALFEGTNVKYIYQLSTKKWDTVVSFNDTLLTTKGNIDWNVGDKYAIEYYPIDCSMCTGDSDCDSNKSDQGYPCRDQVGRGTDQSISPVYAWENVYKEDKLPLITVGTTCPREAMHIKKNRDFFDNTKKPGYKPFEYPHPLRKYDSVKGDALPQRIRMDKK